MNAGKPFRSQALTEQMEKKGLSIWSLLSCATGTIMAQHKYVERKPAVLLYGFEAGFAALAPIKAPMVLFFFFDPAPIISVILHQ